MRPGASADCNQRIPEAKQVTSRAGSKLAAIAAGSYLALAALCIGYELSIRLFDRGNSEFAGMLSMALTLPGVLAAISIAGAGFGVRPGDSDTAFVVILGLGALVNAAAIFAVARAMRRG
jgi:hypothetical protein